MDLSFANQALSVLYLKEKASTLPKDVFKVPEEIDHRVALMKLERLGIKIETMTERQKQYLSSWEEGT